MILFLVVDFGDVIANYINGLVNNIVFGEISAIQLLGLRKKLLCGERWSGLMNFFELVKGMIFLRDIRSDLCNVWAIIFFHLFYQDFYLFKYNK